MRLQLKAGPRSIGVALLQKTAPVPHRLQPFLRSSNDTLDPRRLKDGTEVDGVVTLRRALMHHPEIFVGTLTEKLLTYALGRGLAPKDMPVVRAIVRDAERQEYRFSTLIEGIVTSTPFQMRMAAVADGTGAAGGTIAARE